MDTTHQYGQEKRQPRTILRSAFMSLMAITSIGFACYMAFAGQPFTIASADSSQRLAAGSPQIHLGASTGASILFMSQNNQTIRGVSPERREIPHLVLTRNGGLTPEAERTLALTLTNLHVPVEGRAITLRLETQHIDPDAGAANSRITVWEEIRRVEPPQGGEASDQPVRFTISFTDVLSAGTSTPTGYYRVEVEAASKGGDVVSIHQDYAFLLERQWTVPLSGITRGSSLNLAVYVCDMFPFQRNSADPATRILRQAVPDYVQNELIPNMLEAVRMQTQDWGFSLDGWTGAGHDQVTVVLSDGETWYHGPAPERGHSGIAINANGGDNADYETLTDGLMSTFHHELFHIFQHSIVYENGGDGNFNGKDGAWRFFSEGLATFVSSAAQPDIQFRQSASERAYIANAVEFIGGRGYAGDLNKPYGEMDPYHAALYWRFLFEQCGGMSGNVPNPGMRLVWRTMQLLYGKAVVDFSTSTDLVGGLQAIMDLALSSQEASLCPFRTYGESLAGFAKAIHKLRLADGRSSSAISNGSLFDPDGLYSTPRSGALRYSGEEIRYGAEQQPYPAGIPSSYGMDFIDVQLSKDVQQALTIELHTNPSEEAEFDVQIIYLVEHDSGMGTRLVQAAGFPLQRLERSLPGGPLSLVVPSVDLTRFNRLGVIITRVDGNEELDSVGAYTLVVGP